MRTQQTPTFIAIVAAILLSLGLVAPALAQLESEPEAEDATTAREARAQEAAAIRAAWSPRRGALIVHHGPVDVALADPESDGHRLGDVRVISVATDSAEGTPIGRLDATLTTTAIDQPGAGDERRISLLANANAPISSIRFISPPPVYCHFVKPTCP